MVERFNKEVKKIHSSIDKSTLRPLWTLTKDHYYTASQRKKGLFGLLSKKKINNIPADWELRFGHIVARISWCGNDENGTWALNIPRTMKCVLPGDDPPQIEWRFLEVGNSPEKAKELAEEIVIKDLVIDYTIIVDALSFVTNDPNKFTRVSYAAAVGNNILVDINSSGY